MPGAIRRVRRSVVPTRVGAAIRGVRSLQCAEQHTISNPGSTNSNTMPRWKEALRSPAGRASCGSPRSIAADAWVCSIRRSISQPEPACRWTSPPCAVTGIGWGPPRSGTAAGGGSRDVRAHRQGAGNVETYEFTDIDRSVSTGLSLQGTRWGRHDDTVGLAAMLNRISADRESYLNAGVSAFSLATASFPLRVRKKSSRLTMNSPCFPSRN